MSDIQKESKYLSEHIEECRSRIETIQSFMKSNQNTDLAECRKNIAVLQAAIAAIKEKQRNDELRQKGRLVELPCAVGERIYVLDTDGKPREMILDPLDIRCHCAKEDNLCMATCDAPRTGMCAYRLMNDGSDIGKCVFLTQEAAQVALNEILE